MSSPAGIGWARRGSTGRKTRGRGNGPTPTSRSRQASGAVDGVRGALLEPGDIERGRPSSRVETGEFTLRGQAVIVTSGGIGGNHDLVRASWPERLGKPPAHMLSGIPAHVDGRMLGITEAAGGPARKRGPMWRSVDGSR